MKWLESILKNKKEETIRAIDIMEKEFIKLRMDMNIREAVENLLKSKISGAPVFDGKELKGFLSEKDCFKFMKDLDKYSNPYSFVETYMTRNVITIHGHMKIYNIIQSFLNTPYQCFPVEFEGKIVGLVYRKDVLKFISYINHASWEEDI